MSSLDFCIRKATHELQLRIIVLRTRWGHNESGVFQSDALYAADEAHPDTTYGVSPVAIPNTSLTHLRSLYDSIANYILHPRRCLGDFDIDAMLERWTGII